MDHPQQVRQSLLTQTVELMLAAGMSRRESLHAIDKELMLVSLRRNQGNLCRVARDLGVHRNTLSRNLEELGIDGIPGAIRAELRAARELQPKLPLARPSTWLSKRAA